MSTFAISKGRITSTTTKPIPAEQESQAARTLQRFALKTIENNKTYAARPISAVVVGTPYVDVVYKVSDEFLLKHGLEKDRWSKIENPTAFAALLTSAAIEDPTPIKKTGGSASNTMKVLAALNNPVAFLGKLGTDLSTQFYRDVVQKLKVRLLTEHTTLPMSQIAIFVTPDSKRTMVCFPSRSNLDLSSDIVLSKNPFRNTKVAHFEGYMIEEFPFPFILNAMKEAKKAGATVSFDLGSARLAEDHRPQLLKLLSYVDTVFANESEAEALLGLSAEDSARILSSYPYCSRAVILRGENGALIASRDQETFSSPPIAARKVDSTGCGDAFIGGFLHGLMLKRSLEECAWIGNLLGGTVVGIEGAEISRNHWPSLIQKIKNHLEP